MTESEWLACKNPAQMRAHIGSDSARKQKLAAVACCRFGCNAIGLTDQRPLSTLRAIEEEADGGDSPQTIRDRLRAGEMRDEFWNAANSVGSVQLPLSDRAAWDVLDAITMLEADISPGWPRFDITRSISRAIRCSNGIDPDQTGNEGLAECADAIRDIVGNGFRPIRVSRSGRTRAEVQKARNTVYGCCDRHCDNQGCDCLDLAGDILDRWLTPAVISLAEAAYEERLPDGTLDPLRLSVLADALEEAGCDNSDGVCPECNGSGMLGTLGGKIGCYVCAPDYQTRGTGRSHRRLLRCRCGGNYAIVRKKSFPVPMSSCLKCRADGPPWEDVLRGEVIPHPILAHLRSPGPHWRGCWVVDLLLGKE